MHSILPLACCGVWAALVLSSALAIAQATTAAQATPAGNPPAGAPNGLTQAAVQAGALSFASRVEQVTRFLGFGPGVGASLIPPAAPADQRLFAMQIEVPAGASRLTSQPS
jgi:hypothetical protein